MKRISAIKIRKIWENQNSTKNQVTVQFAQQVQNAGSNPLLALTQGINSIGIITALVSFDADQCNKFFGTTDFEAVDFTDFDTFKSVEGTPFEQFQIEVVENTTQNPNSPNQQPKINPKTQQVLMFNGEPIYRHTQLTMGEPKTELLQHNGTMDADGVLTTTEQLQDALGG